MKKILGIMAAGALLFGFAGQSMASVNLGDLIQVIYENPSVGSTEVVTDLGSVTSDILLSNKTIGSSVITSDFSGVSLSNLTVAYFALSSTSGSSTSAWISGSPSVTEETYATHKGANLTNGWALFSGQYSGAGSTFVGSEGSTGSYYAVYTANSAGSMAGFLKTGNAETTPRVGARHPDALLLAYRQCDKHFWQRQRHSRDERGRHRDHQPRVRIIGSHSSEHASSCPGPSRPDRPQEKECAVTRKDGFYCSILEE